MSRLEDMEINVDIRLDGTRSEWLHIYDGDDNTNHCVLTMTSPEGISRSFDFWNPISDPYASDSDHIMMILSDICNDGLNSLWDEWESIEDCDYERQEAIKRESAKTLGSLTALGFTEDDMLEVANYYAS